MMDTILHRRQDRAKRTPLNTGGELLYSGGANSTCSICDTRRATVKQNEHHMIWKSC